MMTDELINELTTRIQLMTPNERAEFVSVLYGMDFIERKHARELLGIEADEYLKEVWFNALEYRFDSLPDEFLSMKYMEQVKKYGD